VTAATVEKPPEAQRKGYTEELEGYTKTDFDTRKSSAKAEEFLELIHA
jgi:hypothetical protein